MTEDDLASWIEYRRLILSELERIGHEIRSVNEKVDRFRVEDLSRIKTDIALLKFQAAMWGGLGGTAFGAIATAIVKLWFR